MSKKAKSKKAVKEVSPELQKEKYVLIDDVIIGNVLHYKGQEVELTEAGKEYFKSINKIN